MTFYNSALANTIAAINVGFIAKKRFIIIPTTVYTRSILNKLLSLGIISCIAPEHKKAGFSLYKYHRITLAYSSYKPIYTKIRFLSKNKKTYYIGLKALRDFTMTRRGFLILSTNLGILTNFEACNCGVGGIALF